MTAWVSLFFLLAFAISWGGILLVVGLDGFGGATARTDPRFPVVYLAMLAGPAISGLLCTAVRDGTAGLRDLGSRLFKWRVGGRWYAIGLLTAPLVVLAALACLSLAWPGFAPGVLTSNDKLATGLFAVLVGLGAGIFEELGWTGFAVVRLRRQYGVLRTGLVLGIVWSAWHVLAAVWGIGNLAGDIPLLLFLPIDLLAVLPVYRILMVWVYDRTQSLLLSILMHASLTSTLLAFGPAGVTGSGILAYDLVQALLLWSIVLGVAARSTLRTVEVR